MAELKEKKFGYVVQPVCPHPPPPPPKPHPFPPPPGPLPPGMTVTDWTAYINSYIDVRARQLYDKLKGLVTKAGVQEVTYEEADIGSNTKKIGTLKVDGSSTDVNIPGIELETPDANTFINAKPILKFKGINHGSDVDVYCEDYTNEFDEVILREGNKKYRLYMENGILMSEDYTPPNNP